MKHLHAQEKLIETFEYNGAQVELLEWTETLWCGKIGCAQNNTDEPDVEGIMDAFTAISAVPNGREKHWDVCMSFNYMTDKQPDGVMFGFRVDTEEQPEDYDVVKVPSALYMRIDLCAETFAALGVEPWQGGVPPYELIGEKIAPKFGYTYGDAGLPVVEYYGHNEADGHIEICYLYVPVQKA